MILIFFVISFLFYSIFIHPKPLTLTLVPRVTLIMHDYNPSQKKTKQKSVTTTVHSKHIHEKFLI